MREFLPDSVRSCIRALQSLLISPFGHEKIGKGPSSLKAQWSGSRKMKGTLKVIIERKILSKSFKFSWTREFFLFPPESLAATGGWKRMSVRDAFMPSSSLGWWLSQEDKLVKSWSNTPGHGGRVLRCSTLRKRRAASSEV